MARHWYSLPPTDPAFELHALLHDSVDRWIATTPRTDTTHLVVSIALDSTLNGARADLLSNNISRKMVRAIAALIRRVAGSRVV
jgi:hypothetical protein